MSERKTPLFSVVIPCYNRAKTLSATLASLFEQEYADYETIAVDDGSTDATVEILKRFEHRIQFIQQNNSGPGAARNLGIGRASGRYIAFLDSDDLWFPWTLRTFAESIASDPVLVFGKARPFNRLEELDSVVDEPTHTARFPSFLAMDSRAVPMLGACTTAIRRDVAVEHPFVTRNVNAEDTDLYLRVGHLGECVAVQAPFTLGYRVHASSLMSSPERRCEAVSFLLSRYLGGLYSDRPEDRATIDDMIAERGRIASALAARTGRLRLAIKVWGQTFTLQLRQRRLRYLTMLPVLAFVGFFRRGAGRGEKPTGVA